MTLKKISHNLSCKLIYSTQYLYGNLCEKYVGMSDKFGIYMIDSWENMEMSHDLYWIGVRRNTKRNFIVVVEICRRNEWKSGNEVYAIFGWENLIRPFKTTKLNKNHKTYRPKCRGCYSPFCHRRLDDRCVTVDLLMTRSVDLEHLPVMIIELACFQ